MDGTGVTPLRSRPAVELRSWLDVIAELTRAANRGGPLEDLLSLVAGATARLSGYNFCAVLVEDAARESLVIRGSYGLSQEYVDEVNARRPVPVRPGDAGEGPSSRAFRSLRPSAIVDIATDAPSRLWESVAAEQGYVSLLSLPLVVAQVPFGVLNCYTSERHDFSAREVILLESVANQAALAIEASGRLAAERRRADEQTAAVAALQARVASRERADRDQYELLRVLLRGGGLQAVAEKLAQVLDCGILADDLAGRTLASAGRDGRTLALTAPLRQAQAAVLAAAEPSRDMDVADVPTDPHVPEVASGLVVPFVLDDEALGHIWAFRHEGSFGPDQRAVLGRGAAVAVLAMLKERTARAVEWRLSREFLDDLLGLEGPAGDALHARARQLGADLAFPHTVLVVRTDSQPGEQDTTREQREVQVQRWLLPLVQRIVSACSPTGLTAADGEAVVVLWRQQVEGRTAAGLAEHLCREIRAYGGARTATVGVGPLCKDAGEYGDAYRLACAALDLVQDSERGNRVVCLEDIGAYRLLLQTRRPSELIAFASGVLGRVHAYDRQRSTRLAETLGSYMDQRCNVAETAEVLHVHANTVAYRLRRIEELLGVDLHDPRTLLDVELTLMIERVLGGPVEAASTLPRRGSAVTASGPGRSLGTPPVVQS